MADVFLKQDFTPADLNSADLPVRLYFTPLDPQEGIDNRSFLKLSRQERRPGFNGLPVYVVSYQQFDGWSQCGDDFDFNSLGEEVYMSEDHAKAVFLQRMKSQWPEQRTAPNARTQLAQSVYFSFEKTLGQAPDDASGVSMVTLAYMQGITDINELRDHLFGSFVKSDQDLYDGVSAHAAFSTEVGEIVLPAWQWQEIRAAYTALVFLNFRMAGKDPTWEQMWDAANVTSPSVNDCLEDALSDQPTESVGGRNARAYARVARTVFWDMADLSIRIRDNMAAAKAA